MQKFPKTLNSTIYAWSLVALVVAGSGLTLQTFAASRGKNKPTAQSTPRPVVTVEAAKVTWINFPEVIVATGTVTAVDPLSIGAEVNGLKVEEILVEEGDGVTAGQPLARLNSSILEAQLSQARARQSSSLAQVNKAQQPNRPQEVASLRAALAQSQAQATQERSNLKQAEVLRRNAQKTVERYQKVLAEGFVTLQETGDRQAEAERQSLLVEAAQRRVQAADFAVEQARQRLLLAEAGGRSEDIQIAQATTQELSGLMQQLQAQLEQTVVRAPANGKILKREVHLGEISSSGKVMFLIARDGQMELKAEIPQVHFAQLREGLSAKVRYGSRESRGRLWKLSPQIETSNRLGIARILLDASSGLRPGMFAEAQLETGEHRALVVPIQAVLGEGGDYFVFKLDGAKARRASVKTGLRSNQKVEILEGLDPQDSVVTVGAGLLTDGDVVRVKAP